MTMGDLSTVFFSNSNGPSGGTLEWMSPELLDSLRPGCTIRSTRESDCYALGMVIYEVSCLSLSQQTFIDPSQVLTGRRPFHGQSALQVMLAVATGGHPVKPLHATSLGFSDELWALVQSCWSRLGSERPTAQGLLDYLSRASPDWVPPPPYPVTGPDDELDASSSFVGEL